MKLIFSVLWTSELTIFKIILLEEGVRGTTFLHGQGQVNLLPMYNVHCKFCEIAQSWRKL